MTIVQQLTPFTCGLACIESVCQDLGKPKKQEDFLREFQADLIKDASKIEHFGATSIPMMQKVLKAQGFNVQHWRDHDPAVQQRTLEPLDHTRQAVLITAHFNLNSWHSIRFAGMEQGDTIFSMEPTFWGAGIAKYSIANLIKWDYSFLVVSL